MKDLVCSLQTSRQLTENGWTKETYFVWAKQFGYDPVLIQYDEMSNYDVGSVEYFYPAPTLQEALDELPLFQIAKTETKFHIITQTEDFGHENPTEAACMLWLKLREEKLI